jgi:hypothetical protein
MKRVLSPLIGLVLFLHGPLIGQTTSTEILGTVTDQTGAVVPGAKVTLRRAATGQSRETVTSADGNYSFPLIDVGEYNVTVQAQGFKTVEQRNVAVQLQQKARINFELSVGSIAETVEVTASVVTLKTEDSSVGSVIDNRRVIELPLNGRNIATLAVLVPGVQFGVRMGLDGSGGFPIPGNGVAVSANGQREVNQQVTLDGVIATEPRVNTAAFSPSIDALEEFKVQTSSYSAEYGQNSGAIIQMVVKAGTNRFRGTFWEFLRNDKLAAKDYFLNFQQPAGSRQAQKNVLRRNQFGTFLGGPVLIPKLYNGRDRTFWSFNYEGRRETREVVQEAFWYPEAFRRGDFSALLNPPLRDGRPIRAPIIIFDPVTGEPFRDGTGRISNIIPASRINRNAQNFVNQFLPAPMFITEDPLDINARASVPNLIRNDQYMFRIDHSLTSNDKVFVRYITDRGNWDQRFINPTFPYFVKAINWNIGAQWVKIITPTVLNEFRYGVNKSDNNTLNPRSNTDFDLDSLGIGQFRVATDKNRKFTSREAGIPSVGLAGIPGDRDGGNGFDFNTVHQIADNLSFGRGKHNFKAGVEYRRNLLDRAAANLPRGAMSISSNEGGYPLAAWLMGYPTSTTTAEGFPFTAPRQNRWSLYFLDDWKATRRLTVNIGLRWDHFQVPLDSFGAWRSLRLDILTRATDGNSWPTVIPEAGTKNWASYNGEGGFYMPRVGLAYRVTDKWVIRAGAGMFANAQQLNNYTILNLQPPTSGTVGFFSATDVAQVIPFAYGGQNYNLQTRRFRPGSQILTLDNAFPGAAVGGGARNVLLVPPDNKSSSHIQWSFDVQRQLPFNVLLTVGYVGSKSSHLDNTVNWNNPDPSPITNINARRPYPFHVSLGEGNTALPLGNIRYLDSYANGGYHGLQTNFEKRYSAGLVFGVAYTYSKSLGEGYGRNEGQAGVPNAYQNPRDRRASRSRYGFDVTHNMVTNFVYEMPFLNRFKGVAGAFIGGWQMNGILTFRTGFPFNANGGNLNTGGPTLPDRIADGRLDNPTRQLWFDPTAFRRTDCNIPARPELCKYGNAGFGILTTPGAKTVDWSLYKNWNLPFLGDQGRLQFRAEFFNLFNTPQFGQPNNIGWAGPDSVIPDVPRMGEVRSLRLPMRIIQFGLKLYF